MRTATERKGEGIMTITTKHDLGDMVFTIDYSKPKIETDCITCSGTGSVTLGNESFLCPKCRGRRIEVMYGFEKWSISASGIVGQIEAKRCVEGCGENSIRYMLDTTGIGTGRVWEESDVFKSRQEAEDACTLRNALAEVAK